VEEGKTTGILPTPTKAGNTFGGWYTAANGGGTVFTATTTVTADITVYAKWTVTSGDSNGAPPQVNNVDLYTFTEDGGVGGKYTGTGVPQEVLAGTKNSLKLEDMDLGPIGSITTDGKLTLTIPATIPDDQLYPVGGTVPGCSLGMAPNLYLAKEMQQVFLVYMKDADIANGASFKKGWNYLVFKDSYAEVITDISGYTWVIDQSVPQVNNGDLYTFTKADGVGGRYTGGARTVTAVLSAGDSGPSLGTIGSISADGKLTLDLPVRIPEDELLPLGDSGRLGGTLLSTPMLLLAKEKEEVLLEYVNEDCILNGVSLKKGWNYIKYEPSELVTDISGYKWVIRTDQ
jgi:uncharacterized repeat protein (TIGR02543 family)